jgi:hypothetical protein
MAAAAWLVSALCAELPLGGLALRLVRVAAAIMVAALVFYLACRWLRVRELDEAINTIAGRFLRILRRN